MNTKTITFALCATLLWGALAFSFTTETPKVGDIAPNFSLQNIDGKILELSSLKNNNGAIVIFTCNHCPYANKYDERIVELQNNFGSKGFPVIAINPNDASQYPTDSYDSMIFYARTKGYNFPYLYDENQTVAKAYGATKTPQVYLLEKNKDSYTIAYIGAIDNNYKNAAEVTEKYLENAIIALLANQKIEKSETKAIGCSIKWKKTE
jgi:peroxiredoxin